MRFSTGERVFEIVNVVLLVLAALSCLFPVLYVISVSLTPVGVVSSTGGFPIIPRQITFGAYTYVMRQGLIPRAYVNSLTITTVGTIVNMILTILMAYPLSRKDPSCDRSQVTTVAARPRPREHKQPATVAPDMGPHHPRTTPPPPRSPMRHV